MSFNVEDFPEVMEWPVRISSDCTWIALTPLVPVIIKTLKPRAFVELGTHQGDSYTAFCHAIQTYNTGTQCSAIDSWQGDTQTGAYGPEVLRQFREFHDPRFGTFSKLIQSTFDDARPSFADGSIDLLHIDGLHTYEAVRHDYESWLPKLSDRAVVVFHDTAEKLPGFGVWKFWEEIAAMRPSFNIPFGHGFGILAYGNQVPVEFLEFLEALPKNVTFFNAVGDRNEFMKNAYYAGEALHSCQTVVNEWRHYTNQPIRNPTPAWPHAWLRPTMFGPPVVQDVTQLARDAVSLLKEAQELRQPTRSI